MLDTANPLIAQSPLAAVYHPGVHGDPGPDGPEVVLSEVRDRALVSLMAAANDTDALADAVKTGLGLDLPEPNRTTQDHTRLLAFAGLNKWYAMQPGSEGPSLMRTLADALGETATLADQSHGQTVLEIAGEAARDVLAKGVAVDLDPKVFAVGDAAAVPVNHVHVLLWRTQLDTYRLMCMRGFARDLWEFLSAMAAPVGYRVPAV